MRTLFQLSLVFISTAVAAPAASALCGGTNQGWCFGTPCQSGLYAKPSTFTCVARPGDCGRSNQRPCVIGEFIPSCASGLTEDFGKGLCVSSVPASTCGALHQKPCRFVERVPSCDSGLMENFITDRCVQPAWPTQGCTAALDATTALASKASKQIEADSKALTDRLMADEGVKTALREVNERLKPLLIDKVWSLAEVATELAKQEFASQRDALGDPQPLCDAATRGSLDIGERVLARLESMAKSGTVVVSAAAHGNTVIPTPSGGAASMGIGLSYNPQQSPQMGFRAIGQGQLVTDMDLATGVQVSWLNGKRLANAANPLDLLTPYMAAFAGIGPEFGTESEIAVALLFDLPTSAKQVTPEWLVDHFVGISVTCTGGVSLLPFQGSIGVAVGMEFGVAFPPFAVDPPAQVTRPSNIGTLGGQYAAPKVEKRGTIITLSGTLKRSGASWPSEVMRLPFGLRPTANLIFPANQHDGTARIDVRADGQVIAQQTTSRNYLSLDGISFRTFPAQDIPLSAGVVKYHAATFDPPTMSTDGTTVRLQGLMQRSGATWPLELARLPVKYRPEKLLVFNALLGTNNVRIDVHPDGRILLVAGDKSGPWLSLSGIEFVKDGDGTENTPTRRPFPVASGVTPYLDAAHRRPQVAIHNGFVQLSGWVRRAGSTWGTMGTLPEGFRPVGRRMFHLSTHDGFARVDVEPSGVVSVQFGGTGYTMISLSNIRFEAAP